MMTATRFVIVSLAYLLLCLTSHAQQIKAANSEKRVALVIGNSSYATSPLKNPVNDARDIAKALRDLGFEVIAKEDVTQIDMKRAVRDFGQKTRTSDVALFYYAGHAVQVNGENYLVPIGAVIEREEDVEYESVDVGFVLAQMSNTETNTNIVILDACRTDPFGKSVRSLSRGLALMKSQSGTLIAYATAPGSVASDGPGRNGLYTQELLKNLGTPGLDVEEVFKRVRIGVREKTQGRQTPWESSSLVAHFYCRPPNVNIIFEEHFDNNSRGWIEFANGEAEVGLIDGVYVIEPKSQLFRAATRLVAINPNNDFKIECKAFHVSGVTNFGYGLMWGAKDKNYNYFAVTADGMFSVGKVLEGVQNRLVPWSIPNSINRSNATNKLTIEKKGNELHFLINDTFAAKTEVLPTFGDRIGVLVWNKQRVAFDDLLITTGGN
jgi:hypothetical protein